MTIPNDLNTDPRPTTPGVIIRAAERSDMAAVGRLGAILVKTHHEFDANRFIAATSATERGYASFLSSQLDDPDVIVLVAEKEGEVVGYTYAGLEGMDYMALRGPAGVVHDLVVDPAHRGLGIGRLLFEATLSQLQLRGAPMLVLWTAQGNEAARRIFATAGFRPTMVEMTRSLTPEEGR